MAEASNEPYRPLTVDLDCWASHASPEIAQHLFAILDIVDENGALRRALTDPSRSAADRARLVHSLLDGRANGSAVDVVADLASQRSASERELGDGIERAAVLIAAAAAENRGGGSALEGLMDELIRFKSMLDRSPEVQRAFSDSRADARAKVTLARRLRAPGSEEAALLIERAVSAPRGSLPGRLLEHFAQWVADRQQRWIAHVETARPLREDQLARLHDGLNRLYARDLKLTTEVNPSLVGGLRVQVGEEIIDGSVTHRLARLQQRIGA
ncbi:F0F1 ATP synthase subunit delta [Kocuria tytonis]|uniref:ATP synthase subunit delta n=1 Tax=Kocuria tytonis TaxID=2054280 RepID=A0A495A9J1_9MICC|nr:F0F1 ATP synthase subunit delta [Kocuria tytonis]RKQ36658.1 F0F1 ATP synthase subunit delta [Kocuria tytonis]